MMRWRRRRGHRGPPDQAMHVLAQCPAGSLVVVTGNAAAQTVELGLFCGTSVEVVCNDPADRQMILKAGDTRLSVPRDWAGNVFVEPVAAGHPPPPPHARHLLREIRQYIRANGSVDTRTLALHFEMEEDAMAGILAFLATRAMLQKRDVSCGARCAGCKGCDAIPAGQAAIWSDAERQG